MLDGETYLDKKLLKFAAEYLTLLLHIREVSGSNIGPKTGYAD
jgi:hypothetical protein